jgi:hypothetical protein
VTDYRCNRCGSTTPGRCYGTCPGPDIRYPRDGTGDVCTCVRCVERRSVPDLEMRAGERGVAVSPMAIKVGR